MGLILLKEDSQPEADGHAVDMGSQEVVVPAFISGGLADIEDVIFLARRYREEGEERAPISSYRAQSKIYTLHAQRNAPLPNKLLANGVFRYA